MKQRLGRKKQQRCEAVTGRSYRECFTNGTRLVHHQAECWFGEGARVSDADLVDWARKIWRPYIRAGQYV
jgi:hypothetical protein